MCPPGRSVRLASMTESNEYWVALQPFLGELKVFGPFTQSEAQQHYEQLKRIHSSPDKVSSIYTASNFENAEQNATFYLPSR